MLYIKTAAACAVAAALPCALAQPVASDPTLYGVVDTAIAQTNTGKGSRVVTRKRRHAGLARRKFVKAALNVVKEQPTDDNLLAGELRQLLGIAEGVNPKRSQRVRLVPLPAQEACGIERV